MKKLLYLFLGIIGISSCTNDNFIEPLTETTNSEIIHEKLTYEQVSKRMDEKIDFNKGLKNTFKENFISSTKDLMKINNTDEEDSEILIDYFFDPVHDNATYSFITHEFSGEGDYLEKFVLTVEEGEEKVALLRYYPTTDFSAPLFSGKIEVSTLDRSYVGESYIENGITITPQSNGYQTNSVNVDCLTTISIKSTRCGNPGNNHRYGEQCAPGFTNNAYLYVTSFTTCNTTITSDAPVFSTKILEPDPMSGGGGDGSNIVYEQFYQQLSPTFQNWLKTQPNTKNHLLAYLLRHRNSTYYENIAEDLIEFLANDDYLKTNFNPLTEFVLKEALNGNKFNTTEFINFWDNLTNNQKDIFQQYANTNKQYLNGAIRLKPEAEAFLSWAFNYLIDNPTVTVEYIFDNKTEFDDFRGEIDNYVSGGYDTNSYPTFDTQQTWPTISSVIPQSKFVGWNLRLHPDWQCMEYSKEQLRIMGYQISSFGSSGQTFQIYTEQNGVNNNMLTQGLSYLKYALSNGIPVIVGVDVKPGHPNNPDKTTDHFIVIVGMGQDTNGKYFLFYDNASGITSQGANPNNKLYYNSQTGKISGQSQTSYAQNPKYHEYIITHIRKSKSL